MIFFKTILNWKDPLKYFFMFPNGIAGRKWVEGHPPTACRYQNFGSAFHPQFFRSNFSYLHWCEQSKFESARNVKIHWISDNIASTTENIQWKGKTCVREFYTSFGCETKIGVVRILVSFQDRPMTTPQSGCATRLNNVANSKTKTKKGPRNNLIRGFIWNDFRKKSSGKKKDISLLMSKLAHIMSSWESAHLLYTTVY